MVFIVATRWPLAPKYLYYFDSANFALALEKFNPALHQPQPPGYPLFVALTRVIHLWVTDPWKVLLIAGLLGACAATWMIRILANDLFGRPAGIISAVLLASTPVFWFAGITNQIRVFLAVIAVGIALLGWRAATRPESPGWLYAAFAALGVAAGFRPVLAALLVPMLLWVWLRTGHSPGRLAISVALAAATALPWAAFTLAAVGGTERLVDLLWDYARTQFEGSSAVFGASAHSAYRMFASAVVWNLLGPLAWVWAIPFLGRRRHEPGLRDKAVFLALGILPPFLFSAFIHIGDPDQGLGSISLVCVLGGGAVASALERASGRRLAWVCVAMAAVHALTFLFPPGRLARATSYRAVAAVDRMNTAALTAVQSLRQRAPVTIVHYGSLVAPRHLGYYFPEDYVVVLPGAPGRPAPGETPQLYFNHSPMPVPAGAAGALRPGSQRVVCLLPFNAKPSDLSGWRTRGPVFYLDIPPGPLQIGPYTLVRSGG
jgi:4-amino-4-deoxy-L-arabinose transferase-like glycosyltransferase